MKITVEAKELVKAVEKIALAGGKEIVCAVGKDKKERTFLKMRSSNKAVQVECNLFAEVQELDCGKNLFSLSTDFIACVKTLAAGNDEICLEMEEDILYLKTEYAVVPLAVAAADNAVCIKNNNPQQQKCFGLVVETEVLQGDVARVLPTCDTSDESVTGDTIFIMPFKEKDAAELRLVTLLRRGMAASGSRMAVELAAGEEFFDEMMTAKKLLSVPASFLMKISRHFQADTTRWFVFENQIVITDGMDFYTLTMKKTLSNIGSCGKYLFEEQDIAFKVLLEKAELTRAFGITALNQKGQMADYLIMELSDGKVKFLSIDEKNTVCVNVDSDHVIGKIRIAFNRAWVLKAVSACTGDHIRIAGTTEALPIFISDSYAMARTMVLPYCLDQDEEAEGNSKKESSEDKTNSKKSSDEGNSKKETKTSEDQTESETTSDKK